MKLKKQIKQHENKDLTAIVAELVLFKYVNKFNLVSSIRFQTKNNKENPTE